MVSKKFSNDTISIIIRTLYINRFYIERAIFSIYCSDYKSKEIIIVYQGNKNTEFESFFLELSFLYKDHINFKLVTNRNTDTDQRAKNINIGINNASGRFLAFLDDDDFVDPRHYCNLIKMIKESCCIWGYSKCMLNICDHGYILHRENKFIDQEYSLCKLLDENFIPIHSFILDRFKINDNKLIYTNEKLTRLEDYFILLNLASRFNPVVNNFIGVYYNLEFNKKEESDNCINWQNSRIIINHLKQNLVKQNKDINAKPLKCLYKILFRSLIIMIFLIPKIGKRIVKKKKICKFLNDIMFYVNNY